jgi:uracil-DNA glycosylase
MDIDLLGKKLALCNENCDGICNDRKKGILPRCLFLEKRDGDNGAIIVGLNPGSADEKEKKFYMEYDGNNLYDAVKKYSLEAIKDHLYYRKIRKVLDALGFKGDIIWTELVKCQSLVNKSKKKVEIPVQTFRVCINKYLKQEIKEFPKYAIFAIGNKAFEYCSLSFPDHFIVGIPHPAAHGDLIGKLANNIEAGRNKYIKLLKKRKSCNAVIKLK